MDIALLIPAYRPGDELIRVIQSAVADGFRDIVVVDDGSGPEYQPLFGQIESVAGVTILRHAVNLGKGEALKAGINHVLLRYPQYPGIVTADADGQHEPADILGVAKRFLAEPDCMVLGSRKFEGAVPWTNRIGNRVTQHAVRLLTGQRLSDTQTGLRAIPWPLLTKLLKVQSTGYEFELDMLIAAKHNGIRILEHTIKTVYQPGNPTSHFNPVVDSAKIYFVLFRSTIVSLLSAGIDNAVFILVFGITANALASQAVGRIASVCFNYPMTRRAVFLSDTSHARVLPPYLLLVCGSAAISYVIMQSLNAYFGFGVVVAKIAAEGVLYLFNFAIQRDFIFTRQR